MKRIRRWQLAQKREAAFGRWRFRSKEEHCRPITSKKTMQSLSAIATRQSSIEHMVGVQPTGLREMCILEIGGYNFADIDLLEVKTRHKMVLDPLPWEIISDDCEYIKGVGEFIPLKSNSVHICWTTNTIDHCADPPLVLQEIRRVLADSGHLVISCNVFASWTYPLFPIFNRIDSPHPWHFTRTSFLELIRNGGFDCEVVFPPRKPTVRGQRKLTSNFKVLLGRIMGLMYIHLRCLPIQNTSLACTSALQQPKGR